MTDNIPRQPAGSPQGGQFAATGHAEAAVNLAKSKDGLLTPLHPSEVATPDSETLCNDINENFPPIPAPKGMPELSHATLWPSDFESGASLSFDAGDHECSIYSDDDGRVIVSWDEDIEHGAPDDIEASEDDIQEWAERVLDRASYLNSQAVVKPDRGGEFVLDGVSRDLGAGNTVDAMREVDAEAKALPIPESFPKMTNVSAYPAEFGDPESVVCEFDDGSNFEVSVEDGDITTEWSGARGRTVNAEEHLWGKRAYYRAEQMFARTRTKSREAGRFVIGAPLEEGEAR